MAVQPHTLARRKQDNVNIELLLLNQIAKKTLLANHSNQE